MTVFQCTLSRLFVLLLLLVNGFIVFAQPKAMLKRFGRESVIPGADVIFDIHSDQQDRLWTGGPGGIGYFDGRVFHRVNITDRHSRSVPLILREHEDGTIWFITVGKQIYFVRGDDTYLFSDLSAFPEIKTGDNILGFDIDRQNVIHLSFTGRGYFQLSPDQELTQVIGPNDDISGKLLLDPTDRSNGFFCSFSKLDTAADLVLVNKKLQEKMRIPMLDKADNRLNSQLMHYRSYSKLQGGQHLFFQGNFVTVFDESGKVERFEYPYRIISAFQDQNGDLWLGTWRGGLYFFPKGKLKPTPPMVYLEGKIAAVKTQDYEGGLWITSDGDGLYYMPHPEIKEYRAEPENAKFISICSAEDRVYFLTDQQQYGWIQGNKTVYFDLPQRLKETYKTSYSPVIFYDHNTQNIWVTGDRGCAYLEDAAWYWIQFPDSIAPNTYGRIYSSRIDSTLWVNFSNSLIQLKDFQVHSVSPLTNGRVARFIPAADSSNYFTALAKLYRLKNNRIDTMEFNQPDAHDVVKVIDHQWGYLLLGNNYKMSYLYAQQGDSVHWVKYPWGDPVVIQVPPVFDGNSMCFYSRSGLARMELKADQPFDFHVQNQLYHSEIIEDLVALDDTLYALGVGGKIGRYLRPAFTDTLPSVRLTFQQVHINQRDTALHDHYDLSYNQQLLKISYSARTFWRLTDRSERANQFQFRVSGVFDTWTFNKDNYIQLTSLSPGDYLVEVRYRRNSGFMWTKPISMSFTIHPAYWQTWWFRTLIVFGILAFGGGIVALRYRTLRKQQQLEVQKLQAEQKALQAQMNPHFIFNVMNSIQDLVIQKEEEAAVEGISWFARLVRKNLENSFSLEIPLEKEIETLELYLKLEHLRADRSFTYHIEVDPGIPGEMVMVPPMIIQPFVENAIWHGLANKLDGERSIQVEFKLNRDDLICVVKDSGVGRAATRLTKREEHGSLGTTISEERLEILARQKGRNYQLLIQDLTSDSGAALGTLVELTIPV